MSGPGKPGPPRKPWPEKFWSKVTEGTKSECWIWEGAKDRKGYGCLTGILTMPDGSEKKTTVRAHRIGYELVRGTIPQGLDLDHLCRIPSCVNPWHLEPVTRRENTLRGIGPAAINYRKTHCANGHAYNEKTTYIDPTNGWRRCRACGAAAARRKRAA